MGALPGNMRRMSGDLRSKKSSKNTRRIYEMREKNRVASSQHAVDISVRDKLETEWPYILRTSSTIIFISAQKKTGEMRIQSDRRKTAYHP